ncbi:MAG TPA: HDOD domain-containing protein [Terracidiphilus sp.]|nr:HDOD domain-containing protein [Terracidiphilus sp.]
MTAVSTDNATMPLWANLRLPPFSQAALRVVQLASKENLQLHELSELISSDPALASEVLTIVNSLVYAPRFPIASILQAIAVMGANHLQGLCLMVGVRGYLGKSLHYPTIRALWRHNLATAAVAEQLASTGFMDRDIAFTCGLMHDLGRMAFAVVKPLEYAEMLGRQVGPSASILEPEREFFGRDHCQLGAQLVRDWRLPEEFESIVAQHHEERDPAAPWGMVELIQLSCRMADSIGFAAFAGCQCPVFDDLVAELPTRERKVFHLDMETLAAEVARKIAAIEAL